VLLVNTLVGLSVVVDLVREGGAHRCNVMINVLSWVFKRFQQTTTE
jgi:hypothetical protein